MRPSSSQDLGLGQDGNGNFQLQQFRDRVIDLNLVDDTVHDSFLLRWLKAREFNLEKAITMLRKYVEWRKHNPDISSVLDGSWIPSPIIVQGMRYEITGYDNQGRPILWMPIGQHHTKTLCVTGHRQDLHRYTYYLCEQIMGLIEKNRDSGVTQMVAILDMDNLIWSHVAHYQTIQFLLAFFRDFEAYYPEILHSAYIVNASWIFYYIFTILKPILSSRTLGKVEIYSSDASQWKSALLKNLPMTSLPQEYQNEPVDLE